MVLSDVTLKELLETGELVVEPLVANAIQPASIDLTLGDHYLEVEARKDQTVLSLDKPIEYTEKTGHTLEIPAQGFLLATTREYVKLPNDMTAFVEGRSSIGRMGLFIQNAGWVDPGFEGQITLELFNANRLPICLEAGRRICQLVFCKMDRPTPRPYRGKYQGQKNSTGSKVFQDSEVSI